MKDCQWPELEGGGRGRWIQHDKNFGFGLNVARTRHASEIIKTSVSRRITLKVCTLSVKFETFSTRENGNKLRYLGGKSSFCTRLSQQWQLFQDPLNKDTSYRVVVFGGYSKYV